MYFEILATGVQIYECSQRVESSYEWAFKAPEASLVSRTGQPLCKHFAGPTWRSTDGSTVVGEVKARDPGPNASAIPWLLLTAKANTGIGAFGTTKIMHPVATVGGVTPAEPCTGNNVKLVAWVRSTATCYFYR